MSTTNKAKRVISQLLGESDDLMNDVLSGDPFDELTSFARELLTILSNDPSDYTAEKLEALHSMQVPPALKPQFDRMLTSLERWLESGGSSSGDRGSNAIGDRMALGHKALEMAPGNVEWRRLSSDVFGEE